MVICASFIWKTVRLSFLLHKRFLVRQRIANGLAHIAGNIALAPAEVIVRLVPDNGPGGPSYAFLMMLVSIGVTLPVTIPLFIMAGLFTKKQ